MKSRRGPQNLHQRVDDRFSGGLRGRSVATCDYGAEFKNVDKGWIIAGPPTANGGVRDDRINFGMSRSDGHDGSVAFIGNLSQEGINKVHERRVIQVAVKSIRDRTEWLGGR